MKNLELLSFANDILDFIKILKEIQYNKFKYN